MDPIRKFRSCLEEKIGQAWGMLTEGWREVLSRGGGSLTRFERSTKPADAPPTGDDFPRWSLLAAETWETAKSVIIRLEVPGMRKEDFDITIRGNELVVRGLKRSEGDHEGRRYSLMERAYGRFERSIPITHDVDRDGAEVSYQDGVITVILPRNEPTPPTRLSIS